MELKYSGLEHFPEVKNLDKIYMEYKARLKKLNAVDYCDIIIGSIKFIKYKSISGKENSYSI